MGLLGWFTKGGGSAEDRRLRQWREAWQAATQTPDNAGLLRLQSELDALGLQEDDIEIEREMLEGLEHLSDLAAAVTAGGLPILQTGHRVVGTDICHFTCPASMPDEPTQPSGRLLLTNARAIFMGGPGATAPWHSLSEVVQAERDLVLVRADATRLYRFRCNTYGDAMTGAFIARQLISSRRRSQPRSTPGG